MRVGVIGLGNMGGGMARRLQETGASVAGFDLSEAARAAASADGVAVASSAAELAARSELLILSLPHSAAVEAALFGESGVAQALTEGATVLDTSTADPTVTTTLAARLSEQGVEMIDAPVSGGPSAARAGTMTMLLGGDPDAIARVRPVLALLAATIAPVGPVGAGHAAKIANNMLCAANLALVAEAAKLAKAAGVETADLLAGVNAGSGRSGVSEVNFPRWILNGAFDSGFTMGLMRKDVRLAASLAEKLGVAMPAFERVAEIWAESAERLPDEADFNRIAEPE